MTLYQILFRFMRVNKLYGDIITVFADFPHHFLNKFHIKVFYLPFSSFVTLPICLQSMALPCLWSPAHLHCTLR